MAGHLVLIGILELDQQPVLPPLAGEEAKAHQVTRPGRGRRIEIPVSDDWNPCLPEEADRLSEQRSCHVLVSRKRYEVEYVSIPEPVRTLHGHPEHRVTKKALRALHAEDGYRRLGRAWPVTPAQERRVLLRQAGHSRSDPLEQLVERLVELLQHLHLDSIRKNRAQPFVEHL